MFISKSKNSKSDKRQTLTITLTFPICIMQIGFSFCGWLLFALFILKGRKWLNERY